MPTAGNPVTFPSSRLAGLDPHDCPVGRKPDPVSHSTSLCPMLHTHLGPVSHWGGQIAPKMWPLVPFFCVPCTSLSTVTEPRILIMNHNLIEGANQGSKGQERSLRICFSKRINYLGQILRNSYASYFFLSSLEMVALSDLVGGKEGERQKGSLEAWDDLVCWEATAQASWSFVQPSSRLVRRQRIWSREQEGKDWMKFVLWANGEIPNDLT